jgi:hypothetical protein
MDVLVELVVAVWATLESGHAEMIELLGRLELVAGLAGNHFPLHSDLDLAHFGQPRADAADDQTEVFAFLRTPRPLCCLMLLLILPW